jgi:hypothetical protein
VSTFSSTCLSSMACSRSASGFSTECKTEERNEGNKQGEGEQRDRDRRGQREIKHRDKETSFVLLMIAFVLSMS